MTAEAAAPDGTPVPAWADPSRSREVPFDQPNAAAWWAAHSAPARGPVTFVIDWMGRPHTSNGERRFGHWVLSGIHKEWREAGTQAARIAKLRDLPPCAVTFQARYPGGNLPDTGAIAPTGKCIIDGLVDAGVWPDDKAEWVTEERYLPPIKAPGQPAVIVTLTPVVPS